MRFQYNTSYSDYAKLFASSSSVRIYGCLLITLVVVPLLAPKYYIGELTYIFIMCVASMALMVVKGYSGQVSLGHGAFLAVGAYAHALLLGKGVPFLLSLLGASLATGLVGVVVGLPAIRTSGLHLAMVTLAFNIIVENGIGWFPSVTGGQQGMPVPPPVLAGVGIGATARYYYVCLTAVVLIVFGLSNLLRARTGRAFIGIRDSQAAAYALGINVPAFKVLAFVISATFCGLAGALMAHQMQFLTPEAFGVQLSIQLVLMVVIGGLASLHGAILGAVVIGWLPNFIATLKPLFPQRIAEQWGLETFIYGGVLVFFVLFEPRGIYGRWKRVTSFFSHFPLYRKSTSRRVKSYMKSERYR